VTREPFQYAVIRVVPCIEREEFVNVGVIVFCRQRGFLAVRVVEDWERVRLLAPAIELDQVQSYVAAITRVAAGEADAGPIAGLSQSERFGWLTAPSSTTVQTSPVHSGVSDDPAGTLDHLYERLIIGSHR
jgi:Protein of unknown function (DUF3037)